MDSSLPVAGINPQLQWLTPLKKLIPVYQWLGSIHNLGFTPETGIKLTQMRTAFETPVNNSLYFCFTQVYIKFMVTIFEWDPEKNRINIRKHGISFETALLVFEDSETTYSINHVTENGEIRMEAIGLTDLGLVILVIYVDRSNPEQEIIRIISARKI